MKVRRVSFLLTLATGFLLGDTLVAATPQSQAPSGSRLVAPAERRFDVSLPEVVQAVVVGDAVPEPNGQFTIRLEEKQALIAAPYYGTSAGPNMRGFGPPSRQILNVWESEVRKRLTALFPNGVPAGAQARIKIRINIKLTKPPEIGVSIEW